MTADQKLPAPEAPAPSAPEAAAQVELSEHANAIRSIGPRVVADVIEIGHRLGLRKNHLRHGLWAKWLEREFGWSHRTADNFINISKLAKYEKISNLNVPLSGLYLLARPSVSEGVRAEIIQRAKGGEKVNCGMIAHTIRAQLCGRKRTASTAPVRPTKTKAAGRRLTLKILEFGFAHRRPNAGAPWTAWVLRRGSTQCPRIGGLSLNVAFSLSLRPTHYSLSFCVPEKLK